MFLALVGSHAYAQIYEYEVFEAERAYVTYSDCNKAIKKALPALFISLTGITDHYVPYLDELHMHGCNKNRVLAQI